MREFLSLHFIVGSIATAFEEAKVMIATYAKLHGCDSCLQMREDIAMLN